MLIRPSRENEFPTILSVINEGAEAYRGIIPEDRLTDPYMSPEVLEHEIAAGVRFSVCEQAGAVIGVMGVQAVQDVMLIRHAYVRTASQGRGVGSSLLRHLCDGSSRPVLMGAWEDAVWAIRFYERHGFRAVDPATKETLLRRYWTVPERQIETSVVLADGRWWARESMQTAVASQIV